MESHSPICLYEESEALDQRRQSRGTDPFRLGEASDALAEPETLAILSPATFRKALDRQAIESIVDTLLAEIRRIEDEDSD